MTRPRGEHFENILHKIKEKVCAYDSRYDAALIIVSNMKKWNAAVQDRNPPIASRFY